MPHLFELFCGTKSISKVFEANGWTSTSVDFDPRFQPTICCDVLDLTPEMLLEASGGVLPDAIWLSPPCTHYSLARTTAKTPRDMPSADRVVAAALALAGHFGCPYWLENPFTGFLKTRRVVAGIPYRKLDYCSYALGTDFKGGYRKRTAIWTNTAWTPARALCKPLTCHLCADNKRHDGAVHGVPLHVRYSIPSSLPQELCDWLTNDGGGPRPTVGSPEPPESSLDDSSQHREVQVMGSTSTIGCPTVGPKGPA